MSTKKNEAMRAKLLVKPDLGVAKEQLYADIENPDLWYNYGMAVAENAESQAAIEAFSEGLSHHPFSEILHFGRGRKYIGLNKYSQAISDFTMSIRLDPEVDNFWYYRAVANNLNGDYNGAINDFSRAMENSQLCDSYCIIDWIFTSYVEMGDMAKAKKVVDSIPADLIPPQMDYSYKRRVLLYKELIKPEDLIDLDDIKANCVEQKNRESLELTTLLFGLYIYYIYKGDQQKADETLLKLSKHPFPGAFAYIKGKVAAKKRGLI